MKDFSLKRKKKKTLKSYQKKKNAWGAQKFSYVSYRACQKSVQKEAIESFQMVLHTQDYQHKDLEVWTYNFHLCSFITPIIEALYSLLTYMNKDPATADRWKLAIPW